MAVVLKYLAVFLLAGPPVGALAFFIGMAVYALVQSGDVSGLMWIPLFGIIYAVPLSYLIGVVPAGVAGLVIGAKAAFHRPPGFMFAAATGFVVGVGLVYAGGRPMTVPAEDNVASLFLVGTCLVATIVCWAAARAMDQRSTS